MKTISTKVRSISSVCSIKCLGLPGQLYFNLFWLSRFDSSAKHVLEVEDDYCIATCILIVVSCLIKPIIPITLN